MPATGAPWQFGHLSAVIGYFASAAVVRCVGTAHVRGSVTADQDGSSVRRRIVGRPVVGHDAAPRGTMGVMPSRWGVAMDVNVQESGTDYEIRTKSGRLVSSGQTSGRLILSALMRMPRSEPLPGRGEVFSGLWRGIVRTWVIWDVEKQWAVRSVRLVQITARHELDLGSRLALSHTPTPLFLT